MCTVIAIVGLHERHPLILAHNRDEFLARPTTDVAIIRDRAVPIFAGRDDVSRGTWFAIGPTVVAAVTNDRRRGPSGPGALSRGELALVAAESRDLDDATRRVQALNLLDAGAFHLFLADRGHACVVSNAAGVVSVEDVARGVHVLGNFGLNAADDPVVTTLTGHINDIPLDDDDRLIGELKGTLAREGPGWPCVHHGAYGTRSSGIALLHGQTEHYASTAGPSCTSSWRVHDDEISAVRAAVEGAT